MPPLVLIFAACSVAGAASVEPGREPLPAREVERGLVLPKGWTELAVALGRKRADERWSDAGEAVALDGRYTLLTEQVALRHGVAPGHELWLVVPWHQARLEGDDAAVEAGLGDVRFGWRWQLLRREPPSTALAIELAWEAATADEGPTLPLGAGTSELWFGVAGRRQLGGLALTARVDAVHRLTGRVAYLSEGREPSQLLSPGDLVVGSLEALLQAGPLLLSATPRLGWRGDARVGPDTGALRRLDDTDATFADLRLGVGLALTRAVELGYAHERPIVGEDFTFGFVEELHPTRGATSTITAKVRF